ncbi:MAG: 5'-methylthioadenosine/adenosylhomocysteine nucleosidase, partial [Alkaliphilus sp.]|nr:5'-methylthioadenosine/adenosylhomocysteine nucleosidase [Alkaliphilus sp.]
MNSIGIIGAMDEEIAILVDKIKINKKFKRAKMEFYVGRYSNKEVVVVKSGIGKVNASVCSQILVSEFHV